MKKITPILLILTLLISTLLISTVVFAKPFINTAPTDSEITHYIVTIDGAADTVVPEGLGDGTARLQYDLGPLDLSSGQHDVTIQGINDLWGLETSAVPFVFSKPASLVDPAGIGLSAE